MRQTTEITLPMLYDKNMNIVGRLHPVSASLSLELSPPSSATMILPKNEEITIRDFVQMCSPAGQEGIYRVSNLQKDYVTGETTVMLEHAISILDDSIANEGLNVVTVTAPKITAQPADATVAEGGTAVFSVTATGNSLSYQWQYRSPSGNWTNSAAQSATTASLSIGAISARNGYKYRCIITDATGAAVVSDAATLTVQSANNTETQTETQEETQEQTQEETPVANPKDGGGSGEGDGGQTTPDKDKISTKTDVEKTVYAGDAQTVLTQILASQHVRINNIVPWVVGTIQASTEQINIEVNHDTLFDLFMDLLDQLPDYYADFNMVEGLPWSINIRRKPTVASAEGRLSRNISNCVVSYDDSELCTRVYVDGVTGGYIDADTINQYGVVEEYLDSGDALTAEERVAIVNKYLNLHKRPKVSISIDAQHMFQITGENLDYYRLGTMYRLALPEYNTVENELITSIYYQSVYDDIGKCRLTLANEAINLASELDKLKKKVEKATGGGGGGGGGGVEDLKEELDILKIKYDMKVEKDDQRFAIIASESYWDELQERYQLAYETAFEQTARYIQLIATETEIGEAQQAATSLFKIASDLIELRVEKSGIISAINLSPEGIQIQAAKVDLGEYATVGQLDAKYATIERLTTVDGKIDSLMTGQTTASNLYATNFHADGMSANTGGIATLSCNTFSIGGTSVSLMSKTVITGINITLPSVTLGPRGDYLYGSASTGPTGSHNGWLVTGKTDGHVGDPTTATIYYVGASV